MNRYCYDITVTHELAPGIMQEVANSEERLLSGPPRIYYLSLRMSNTYDHRILNSALPVRSAVLKQDTGGLVVRWVTTSESPLLYVFGSFWILGFGESTAAKD
ncbi:uncharacterized protein K460DRAFT_361090 [Cucurbitaria berberidis CBS 394.84]|uniref:Uncharacterized protein n=1 Tax=Cucurbitaria berberidis CBS 394.84 TaxID=1168544 RepID=A0A9P4GSJ4_9PLEO|nr:uncharacterized protein K460DRAFT_361090 [Cucurbitaria berberidis CBS 394.84]KAF1850271.1 hypothetical protein K460DRAFT_361090 [Cucurbitaria berberidis CBS 394.84]